MDIKLQQKSIDSYAAAANITVQKQVSCETIVPDAQPDIFRILESTAKAFIRSKDSDEGSASVSGYAGVVLLYSPEGESGIKKLEISIPYSISAENDKLEKNSRLVVSVSAAGVQTKMINPRKIYVSVNVIVRIVAYNRVERLFFAYDGAADKDISVLPGKVSFFGAASVREREFVLDEGFSLPPSSRSIAEILSVRSSVTADDIKAVGSKMIFKGSINYRLLYRPENSKDICCTDIISSYSQIMDAEDTEENVAYELSLFPTGEYYSIDEQSGDGRSVKAEIHMVVQAVCETEKELEYMADVYSTVHPIEFETQQHEIRRTETPVYITEVLKERLQTDDPVESVADYDITTGVPRCTVEGNELSITQPVGLSAVYRDYDGDYAPAAGTYEVCVKTAVPENADFQVLCSVQRDTTATADGSSIEFRVPLRFDVLLSGKETITCVSSVTVNETESLDSSAKPSIVLYRAQTGEKMWDIAKRYFSSVELICEANSLDLCGSAEEDMLLLIPKKR